MGSSFSRFWGDMGEHGWWEAVFPDFQEITDTDLGDWSLGHLNKGLLVAHGIDEGGEPEKGIGGHDVMWFALRDLAFGSRDFPTPQVPENIGREKPDRFFPMLSEAYEGTIDFLLNLLMIEFRAERGFALSEAMLRDPDLFADRREGAMEAADVVDRIRTDERIHVTSLRVYLGELRALELKGAGGRVSGAEVVDTLWQRIVRWATVEQPPLIAEQQRILLHARINAASGRAGLLDEFDALAEAA